MDLKNIETSSNISNVTPPAGKCIIFVENDNDTLKLKAKLSDGSIVEVAGGSSGGGGGGVGHSELELLQYNHIF